MTVYHRLDKTENVASIISARIDVECTYIQSLDVLNIEPLSALYLFTLLLKYKFSCKCFFSIIECLYYKNVC